MKPVLNSIRSSLLGSSFRRLRAMASACLCFLALWGGIAFGEVFSSSTVLPTIQHPNAITAGDLNGDGNLDFVVGSLDSSGISIHLGDGNGNFTQHLEFGYANIENIRIVNLDGDAYPDLAIPTGQTILLYYGAGDGTFPVVDEIFLPGSVYESMHMAVGDFNGDGRSDFAVTNLEDPGSVSVLLSTGDGTYDPKVDYPTFVGPEEIVAADVNGDARLDLVVTIPGCCLNDQNAVSVFLGNADGTFGARKDFGTALVPVSLVVQDLNGDTKPDIAVGIAEGKVSVLFGTGDGNFGVNTDYTVSTRSLDSIGSADFDGDNDNDLVVTSSLLDEPGIIVILLNDGTGQFPDRLDYPAGTSAYELLPADLNSDQRPDLLVASRYGSGAGLRAFLNCVPCTSTAVEVALLDATADESGVHIRWTVSDAQDAVVTVERRTGTGPWQTRFGPEGVTGSLFSFDDLEAAPGERYAYRLTVRSSEGTITTPETWVEAYGGLLPRSLVLDRPFPNPSSGAVRLRLGLPHAGVANLEVFDVSGRLVARVFAERRPAGWHELTWDGRDREGRPVASGTYFLRLTAGDTVSRRFVVLR